MDYSDDRKLLSAINSGDSAAFEYLYRSYYPRLRGYTLRFVDDGEVADDIVQECFLKFWEKRQFFTSTSLTSLLFSMIRNACINYLKHLYVEDNYRLDFLANLNGEERLYQIDFHSHTDNPLLYKELQTQIKHVISQLPERCREVFLMSRFQGLKNREIAEKLNISTTAVEKHLSKAMKTFDQHFRKNYPMDIYLAVIAWLLG
jgi:RNA polymerase sigma-70 factor (family 1)